MSRLIRSRSSRTPAGMPVTMTVSCGPCDSPAETKVKRDIWRSLVHRYTLLDGQVLTARALSGDEEPRVLQPCGGRTVVDACVRGDGELRARSARIRCVALARLVRGVRSSARIGGEADRCGSE